MLETFKKKPPQVSSFQNEQDLYKFAMIAGIILLVLMFTFNGCKTMFNPSSEISSRKTTQSLPEVHITFTPNENLENITSCDKNNSKCSDVKNVTKETRQEYTSNLEKFDNEHESAMYMFYAPWCPHCHNVAPAFAEASKNCSTKFALCNAELIEPKKIQGIESIVNVTHFPFLCKKEEGNFKVFDGKPTASAIAEFAEPSKTVKPFA
jgi:thiol-disulfide isomerase/thioredoxin